MGALARKDVAICVRESLLHNLIAGLRVMDLGFYLPMIDPVQPDDLRRAVLGFLREWWSPMLNDPARLRSGEYQAYAVLTMCRALYTLQRSEVVSKPAAARWAQETLGERWAALIAWALAWHHDAASDKLNETLDLIRYTSECSQPIEAGD